MTFTNTKRVLRGLRPLVVDVIAPMTAYYGLHTLGVGDLPALLAGGGLAVADALISLVIERRLRPLPVFVGAMFAFTGALAYAVNDPRLVMMKASFVSTAFGIWLLVLAARRPALYAALAPVIARGSETRGDKWKVAWARPSPARS